jgi:hypothetical protein
MPTSSRDPDFVMRFPDHGIKPWIVPMRQLTRALNAVQRLIEHTEDGAEDEEAGVEEPGHPKKPLHLLGVTSGSAAYKVSAPDHVGALRTISQTGAGLEHPSTAEWDPESLSAIEDLSEVAKSVGCDIEFSTPGKDGQVLAKITPLSYESISRLAFVTGESTVCGYLERVGGATEMHCGLRFSSQPEKMVICRVATDELIRRLGQHVYEDVRVSGTVTWYRKTWRIKRVEVRNFEPAKSGSILQALEHIYDAGGKAWDDVDDPESLLSEVRGS